MLVSVPVERHRSGAEGLDAGGLGVGIELCEVRVERRVLHRTCRGEQHALCERVQVDLPLDLAAVGALDSSDHASLVTHLDVVVGRHAIRELAGRIDLAQLVEATGLVVPDELGAREPRRFQSDHTQLVIEGGDVHQPLGGRVCEGPCGEVVHACDAPLSPCSLEFERRGFERDAVGGERVDVANARRERGA